MKISLQNIISVLFLGLMMILIVSTLNVFSIINKANDYHNTTIAEVEASNFASSVINAYENSNNAFKTEITDKTVLNQDKNLERVGRIYEVKTTYIIKIPVINYEVERSIQGFAR